MRFANVPLSHQFGHTKLLNFLKSGFCVPLRTELPHWQTVSTPENIYEWDQKKPSNLKHSICYGCVEVCG